MKTAVLDFPMAGGGTAWRGFYRAGAAAAWVAALVFRRNLDAEWWLLRGLGAVQAGPVAAPARIEDWFALLQGQPLLGLTLLNLFDLANYALVGVILLALAAALRKTHPGRMAAAALLAVVGVTLYFASNQAFSLLALSQGYAAAPEAQRPALLAAGQALLALHQNNSYAGSGLYLSFLLVASAGLLIALGMRRIGLFGKGTAWVGILANGFQLSYYLVRAFAPGAVALPISISAVFLLIWYLQVGSGLWRLARQEDGGCFAGDHAPHAT